MTRRQGRPPGGGLCPRAYARALPELDAPARGTDEWARLAAVAVFTVLVTVLLGLFAATETGERVGPCRADAPVVHRSEC